MSTEGSIPAASAWSAWALPISPPSFVMKEFKAGVAWYGRLVGPTDNLHPKNPVDVAGSLHAPVLGLYGGADAGIPRQSIEQMRQALTAAHQPSEIVVYPDAPHGFNADYRPTYNETDAREGWSRMLAWFKKNGV